MSDRGTRGRLAADAWLVAVSVGVSVALLAGAEGALRAAGVGGPEPGSASRLRYQQISFPTLEPARRADGSEVLRPVDPRLGHQEIRREKPPGGLRVIVLGGSAAAGLGF